MLMFGGSGVRKKSLFLYAALITLSLVYFAVLYFAVRGIEAGEISEITPDDGDALIAGMLAQIERQDQIDNMLLSELSSGAYGFDDPLVVVDPYGMSPLTALALFGSDEPVNISIHIPGNTESADIVYTFEGYHTLHMVPIYGLYPGKSNTAILTAKTLSGVLQTSELEIETEPLPPELARNIILTDSVQPENYQPGFNYTFIPKTAFDINGQYRWFYNDFGLLHTALYDYYGHMVFSKGNYHEGDTLLFSVNALGRVHSVYYSPYGAHHDIASSNGSLLVTGSRGETIEDIIYEIDKESGDIINILDLKYVFQRTRPSRFPFYTTTDWFHHNAVLYDSGSIIISGRNQSAAARITWPEGKILWILSDHSGWNLMFQKYLLTPVGDGFEWFFDQHTPRILPDFDDNPDTIDILLFDNGTSRFDSFTELRDILAEGDYAASEPYSRLVHYRIDERAMTVEQVWQFGKELGGAYHSFWASSADYLENGNRLGAFDRNSFLQEQEFVRINANFIEVDSTGRIVWEAYAASTDSTGDFLAYRLERRPLYTSAANNLNIGVPVQVLIPEQVMRAAK